MTSDASLEDSLRTRKGGGVNAMTCYSVQFHLSNKTDVVLFPKRLRSSFFRRAETGCGSVLALAISQ